MTELNHAAISLPAAAFDYDKLKAGAEAAARAGDDHTAKTAEALDKAIAGERVVETGLEPGFVYHTRTVEIDGLKVNETIQVYRSSALSAPANRATRKRKAPKSRANSKPPVLAKAVADQPAAGAAGPTESE